MSGYKTQEEYTEICRQFYIATGIPTVLLHGKEVLYSSIGDYLGFSAEINLSLTPFEKNPEFCGTIADVPYGRVQIEGTSDQVVIGPAFSFVVDDAVVRTYMQEYGIPAKYREALLEYLSAIPVLTHIQFANFLLMLHTLLNGKVMGTQEFLELQGAGPEPQQGDRRAAEKAVETAGAAKLPGEEASQLPQGAEGLRDQLIHLDMRKKRLYRLIRLGNEKALSEYLSRHPRMFEAPKMAGSMLRQAKDEFIALTAEAAAACLEPAGVPLNRIRDMKSAYIQKCEQLQSVEIIHWLRSGMLLDFCRQAGRAHLPENISPELLTCLQYIRENLGSPVRTEDIAGSIGRSVSYTQKLFRKELSLSPGEYLSECRIEQAKELLRNGNDPLNRIAYTLGYSSQAHFQSAFKKAVEMTPQQYRRTH